MIPLKKPNPNTPEAKIQKKLIDKLTLKGWFVKSTHGNAYQKGLPDLFCCHQSYGIRWIEVKQPVKYRFTSSQLTVFKGFASKNLGVWVLTSDEDYQYDWLFKPANWHTFLFDSRGIAMDDEVEIIPKRGPEAVIQNALIRELKRLDWFVVETYGSMYQAGFPDLFAVHKEYGSRWIECKNPKRWHFTPAQIKLFPRFAAEGVGIYILMGVDINKLFQPANLREYL